MGYVVKRYVNDKLVTQQELSLHTIMDATITNMIGEAIAKNNQRYRQQEAETNHGEWGR